MTIFLFFQEVTVTEKGEEKKIYKKVEDDRELMGVARVGELAKGLLLTGTAYLFIPAGNLVNPDPVQDPNPYCFSKI